MTDYAYRLKTKSGSLHALPYNLGIHDIVLSLVHQRFSPELVERAPDQFHALYEEGANQPRVVSARR